jgi:hypothetical protein
MRALRRWSLLLVPGGFVAGHELGYLGASGLGSAPRAGGGHGYLAVAALVALPFALAALARAFLAGLWSQLPPVRLSTLAAGQLALFLAVELAEHAALGVHPVATLSQPAVLLGLAGQLAVAGALYLIVRSTHEVGAAVATATRRATRPVARPAWRPAVERFAVATAPVSAVTTRGPPALLLAYA